MKRRFTDQQIIGILKENEAGVPLKELCRKHGMSDATYYKWKSMFAGMWPTTASLRWNMKNDIMKKYQVSRILGACQGLTIQKISLRLLMDRLEYNASIKSRG